MSVPVRVTFIFDSVSIAYGSTGAEASWVLEENQAMRQVIETYGGRVYRRWRIYDRAIA